MDHNFATGFEKVAAITFLPKILKVVKRVKYRPTEFPRTVHSQSVIDIAKSFRGREHKIDAFRNKYGNETLKKVMKALKAKKEHAASLKGAAHVKPVMQERVWDAGKQKREYLEKLRKDNLNRFKRKHL